MAGVGGAGRGCGGWAAPSRKEKRNLNRNIPTHKLVSGLHLFVITALLAGLALGLAPSQAHAATFNIADGDVAALINAITTANGNGEADIINLAADGTYTLTAVDNNTDGPNGLPSITSEITINGNGATIQRSSAGGTPAFRIFHVAAGGNMTLNDLTVTNGKTPDGGACTGYDCDGGDGGGIYTNNYYGGAVTIVNSTLSGNSTGNGDTDGRGGGLVSSTSSSVLTNVTISGNTAKGHGGALWHNTNGSGGPKRVF